VIQALQEKHKELSFEIIPLKTRGDKITDVPLADFGGKGAFVTEFEEALLEGRIDMAVHSAKDMPAELSEGLSLWGVLKREDARDVLLTCRENTVLQTIGTSSRRRELQIKAMLPVSCETLRGNVPTRIRRLKEGSYDGIILAAAGLKRLSLDREEGITYRPFSFEEMIPAGGQGIIAVQGRKEDKNRVLFDGVNDELTWKELETERFLLQSLQAGCHEPVGAFSQIEGDSITIRLLLEEKGSLRKGKIQGKAEDRFLLAEQLINEVRTNGK
jgi:hydroxymethylbilane synthase/uroporphyrinogen III methyltransferase/synthase